MIFKHAFRRFRSAAFQDRAGSDCLTTIVVFTQRKTAAESRRSKTGRRGWVGRSAAAAGSWCASLAPPRRAVDSAPLTPYLLLRTTDTSSTALRIRRRRRRRRTTTGNCYYWSRRRRLLCPASASALQNLPESRAMNMAGVFSNNGHYGPDFLLSLVRFVHPQPLLLHRLDQSLFFSLQFTGG